jgi:hypothetical protein
MFLPGLKMAPPPLKSGADGSWRQPFITWKQGGLGREALAALEERGEHDWVELEGEWQDAVV